MKQVAQTDLVTNRFGRRSRRRAGAMAQMRAHQNVVANRKARERLNNLKGPRNAAASEAIRRFAGDVHSVINNASGAWLEKSGDD